VLSPDKRSFARQDADSEDKQGKKSEGAYYMWTEQDVDDALGPERARVFKPHYFVKPGGNAVLSSRSDPHHEFAGLNTLIERQSVADTAKQFGDARRPAIAYPQRCLAAVPMICRSCASPSGGAYDMLLDHFRLMPARYLNALSSSSRPHDACSISHS